MLDQLTGWKLIVAVALAGAVGTLARYGLAKGLGTGYGTFAANLAGCFLFGLLAQWLLSKGQAGGATQAVLLTGFMGAFTTFSTFSVDTVQLIESGRLGAAAGNVAGNLSLGLAAAFLGLALVRALM